MLSDIVIDTNVLVHAQNPSVERFVESRNLLNMLLACATMLCVDEGFNFNQTENRSFIGLEYLKHLTPGSVSFQFVVSLASNGRIKRLPKNAVQQSKKIINQLIRKQSDRIFLSVACNSSDKTLISHDYEDFQIQKRKTLKQKLGVIILAANECM